MEDSPSNYRGMILALRIKEKECKTYDAVADIVVAYLIYYRPLKTQLEEDKFLKYFKLGSSSEGIGTFIHTKPTDLHPISPLSKESLGSDYYSAKKRQDFSIFNGAMPTDKFININPLIKEILQE